MIGYLPSKYQKHENELNQKLFQVTEIYSSDSSSNKRIYSEAHKGVCHAVLVENVGGVDLSINGELSCNESASSDEE